MIFMNAHPFSSYSDAPEGYRILKREWAMVENVLNAKGKFGPGLDENGNETRGDYRTEERNEKVGMANEDVIILRTDDPEVKKLLGELKSKSEEPHLSRVTPESTLLPKLPSNAIKPLGEIEHYEEYEMATVAPMSARDVRKAFEHYNREYRELNGFRKMDGQLTEILEKRHYTLQEIRRDGQTHTMIIPSEDAQRREELDRAMNSGEVPIGKTYSTEIPQAESTDAGKKKLRR
ncbi:hypothetical protein JW721_03595 [Candidatus Micrarchaeota archaeon]|nr:hypothetical protein [Candidatus Micrarchaeota archaeon]